MVGIGLNILYILYMLYFIFIIHFKANIIYLSVYLMRIMRIKLREIGWFVKTIKSAVGYLGI